MESERLINKSVHKIIIKAKDNKIRGKIYGRDRSNLAWIKQVLNRHFKGIEVVME